MVGDEGRNIRVNESEAEGQVMLSDISCPA